MKTIRSWSAALVAALVLAACGGGDVDVPGSVPPSGAPTARGNFTTVVSFGDSLSDVGTYAPATSLAGNGTAPFFGGKFTTNSDTATVWVQNVAATLGVPLAPAEVGFGASSVRCPVLPANCTAYGQGGARVTDPNGIGRSAGALTVPVSTQIDNHLARFGGFRASDLIFVFAGSNDALIQFSAFAAAVQQIQGQAAAGQISTDQANALGFEARTRAQGAMKQAALELAGSVRSRILANGGQYVAVLTLPDIGDTPFGLSLPAGIRPDLTDLSRIFNLWLREGLAGAPVQIVDTFALFKDVFQNPQRFGIANNTTPACAADRISAVTGGRVTDGSSLFCNSTPGAPFNGLATGASAATWFFADTVHPTTTGHRLLGEAVLAQLSAFGWI